MEGMKYKIGDVARILGISTDLLRYYEKIGVVRPVKHKANDYRYYEAWDINFLMDCLWMKGFGFGIEEIGHMVTSCPYDELMDHFRHKEGDLAEELKWKELVLRRLRRHRKEVAAARDYVGQQLFKGFLFGWLLIFIPVHIGQTPEKSLIAHVIGHFQVAFTVFALGGTVILFHWLSRGLLVQGFQVIQFLFKGFLGGDFRHIRMVEGMVSHIVALGNHSLYQVRTGL